MTPVTPHPMMNFQAMDRNHPLDGFAGRGGIPLVFHPFSDASIHMRGDGFIVEWLRT